MQHASTTDSYPQRAQNSGQRWQDDGPSPIITTARMPSSNFSRPYTMASYNSQQSQQYLGYNSFQQPAAASTQCNNAHLMSSWFPQSAEAAALHQLAPSQSSQATLPHEQPVLCAALAAASSQAWMHRQPQHQHALQPLLSIPLHAGCRPAVPSMCVTSIPRCARRLV